MYVGAGMGYKRRAYSLGWRKGKRLLKLLDTFLRIRGKEAGEGGVG